MAKTSKRQEKKNLKKSLGYKQGQKISKQELQTVVTKEKAKRKRANDTARRYNNNKQYLQGQGVPTDIITKSTTRKETERRAAEWKKEQKRQQRKAAAEKRYNQKVERLKGEGYSEEYAKKAVGSPSRQKSWLDITEGARKFGDTTLYIGFADAVDNGFHVDDLSDYSTSELEEMINERIEEAVRTPDGSDTFSGAFKVYVGDLEKAQKMANAYYKRGYNFTPDTMKWNTASYSSITIADGFTKHEFLSLIYTCITQMRNDEVPQFMREMRRFDVKNGFHFTDNLDFGLLPEKE